MLKTMFQIKPLLLKSQTVDGDSEIRTPTPSEDAPSSSPFDWMSRKRALSLNLDRTNSSSLSSTPTKDSPVKAVVNLIEDLRKDMELALRLRDVFILQEEDKFIILQVLMIVLIVMAATFKKIKLYFYTYN